MLCRASKHCIQDYFILRTLEWNTNKWTHNQLQILLPVACLGVSKAFWFDVLFNTMQHWKRQLAANMQLARLPLMFGLNVVTDSKLSQSKDHSHKLDNGASQEQAPRWGLWLDRGHRALQIRNSGYAEDCSRLSLPWMEGDSWLLEEMSNGIRVTFHANIA